MSREIGKQWYNNQKTKNETRIENLKKIREVEKMKNKMIVAVDAGKGYTKYAYEKIVTGVNKEGKAVSKPKWFTDIDLSSVVIGEEAEVGSTTYITTNGVEKKYNFFGTTKMVENKDISKDNEEHKVLMQRALFKISLKENVTDFDLVMCMSLDQYKEKEKVEKMQKTMSVGTFTIKETINEVEEERTITVHNVVIEPETLVSTRFANVKFKDVNAILVDIGTLNVGIAPIEEGRVDMANITAPRKGYNYMIHRLKEYCDSKKSVDYPTKMLDIYVRKQQGTNKEMDELLLNFWKDVYSVELKKEIDSKGYGTFTTLVFLGGTSVDCAKHIKESFAEYQSVEVINDIYATVKGAYKRGVKDLEKLLKEKQLAKQL